MIRRHKICTLKVIMATPEVEDTQVRSGRGLSRAIGFSASGIRHALKNEAAIRNEFIALSILVPISALLPVTDIEHLVLVLCVGCRESGGQSHDARR